MGGVNPVVEVRETKEKQSKRKEKPAKSNSSKAFAPSSKKMELGLLSLCADRNRIAQGAVSAFACVRRSR